MRLFLAVDLPQDVRQRLRALQSGLRRTCRGWRWVRSESIHLTLRFLGEVDEPTDAACRQAWRQTVEQFLPFHARLEGLGRFPTSGRPRVLWVGIRAEPPERLAELAAALEAAAREGGFAPETRAYHPHLTLARADRRPRLPETDPLASGAVIPVNEVVLFQSRLGPGGARYTALERFALRGGSPGRRDS